MKRKYAIIVVGYNREKSLERVLRSVCAANYYGDRIDLIISLDYCEKRCMKYVAENCDWCYGSKIVKMHSERLGLKRHILECGSYLDHYDAVAVLEDDVVVAPGFYNYMRQAVEYYESDSNIAGISLYNHQRNILCGLAFTPAYCGKETYFLQFAQSWGQIWLRRQWKAFEEWLKENGDKKITDIAIPERVRNWPDTSWLKYHIQYCIEKNKFFVYPYFSFSSCYSDAGEHTSKSSGLLQVVMNTNVDEQKFHFAKFEKSAVRYDAFFERIGLEGGIGISDGELCTDIYGMKEDFHDTKFLLTTKRYDYKVIKSYGMVLKPHENNVIYNEAGKLIYLYDTEQPGEKKRLVNQDAERSEYYDISLIGNMNRLRYTIKKMLKN